MRQWLRFLGIEVVEEIVLAPTLDAAEAVAVRKHDAARLAHEAGGRL